MEKKTSPTKATDITGTPHQHSERQYECLGLFSDSSCVIFIGSIVNIFMIFHKGHWFFKIYLQSQIQIPPTVLRQVNWRTRNRACLHLWLDSGTLGWTWLMHCDRSTVQRNCAQYKWFNRCIIFVSETRPDSTWPNSVRVFSQPMKPCFSQSIITILVRSKILGMPYTAFRDPSVKHSECRNPGEF